VLPTFGSTLNYFTNTQELLKTLIPRFDLSMTLHGEEYLEILQFPIPTSATLDFENRVLEVIDKGAAAVVRTSITSIDRATRQKVFYSEVTTFVRGSGGFGGERNGKDRGAATAANKPPPRKPDHVTEEKISLDQAIIYRLSGDYK
jgi:multifunctional beta-oxidation protein